jgi:hypothetical protein
MRCAYQQAREKPAVPARRLAGNPWGHGQRPASGAGDCSPAGPRRCPYGRGQTVTTFPCGGAGRCRAESVASLGGLVPLPEFLALLA